MHWLNDNLVTNPMRECSDWIPKSNPFRRFPHKKVALFLHKKTTKNSKIIISLQILPIKSFTFNKFPKIFEKNVKKQHKILNFPSIFTGKNPTCRKIFPLYKQPDENYNQFINLHCQFPSFTSSIYWQIQYNTKKLKTSIFWKPYVRFPSNKNYNQYTQV